MKSIVCLECNQAVANTNNVLARHLRSIHSLDWPNYIVKHQFSGIWPTCECGCGDELPWRKNGFARFIKGHENRGLNNPMFQKKLRQLVITDDGWVVNPWSGKEEMLNPTSQRFIQHCVKNNDSVIHDHGIKIGWEDSSASLLFYIPTFRHMTESIIYDLEGFTGTEGHRRLAAVKQWCDEYGYIMLSLTESNKGEFDVVDWYNGKE